MPCVPRVNIKLLFFYAWSTLQDLRCAADTSRLTANETHPASCLLDRTIDTRATIRFCILSFNAVCCRKVQKKLEGFSFGFSFLCVACSNGALFILLRNRWRTPHGCIIKFPQRKRRTLRQTPSGISLSSGDVALLPGTLTSSFSSSSSSISRCCASPPLWFYGKKFSWFPRIHLS